MNQWINSLKKITLELEALDAEAVISKRMYASKLMRGSGLSGKERAQVVLNCGGHYEPERLTKVLLVSYADIGDTDHRKGRTFPVRLKTRKTIRPLDGIPLVSRMTTMKMRWMKIKQMMKKMLLT